MGRAISRPQAGTLALDSIDGGTAWLGAHNNHVLHEAFVTCITMYWLLRHRVLEGAVFIATLFVLCRAVALLMFRRARNSELQCFSGGISWAVRPTVPSNFRTVSC
ncbi:uncharacterized protein LAESUDRAFT_240543 [Laetiporus sulphureus 93-53]|uniref:Uncharacterized protein n=1 Tax=Laetiporus sulphureus 93-53 TaxID=1314785 RepID=A0A165DK02_9APHY|nr:uncharacterized protein LAESUDRAFT_240543 [Laetiporus sulphureus 93-53]KZT05052.1 hypothetical protein LAESUDRAFT_240543 [Laetiporus sulphureus 93-53]